MTTVIFKKSRQGIFWLKFQLSSMKNDKAGIFNVAIFMNSSKILGQVLGNLFS